MGGGTKDWSDELDSPESEFQTFKVKLLITQSCLTIYDPARLLCPWNSLGKNTGVGCRFLLQGIFPT